MRVVKRSMETGTELEVFDLEGEPLTEIVIEVEEGKWIVIEDEPPGSITLRGVNRWGIGSFSLRFRGSNTIEARIDR